VFGPPGAGKTTILSVVAEPFLGWHGYADEWDAPDGWEYFTRMVDGLMSQSHHAMARRFHREIRASVNRMQGVDPGVLADESIAQRALSLAMAFSGRGHEADCRVEAYADTMPLPIAAIEVTAPIETIRQRNARRAGPNFAKLADEMVNASAFVATNLELRGLPVLRIDGTKPAQHNAAEIERFASAVRERVN
jgi:hypothetical protein